LSCLNGAVVAFCMQAAFVENLDQGRFFDLLYEGEDDVLKLDILEMVASVRQTYLLLQFV